MAVAAEDGVVWAEVAELLEADVARPGAVGAVDEVERGAERGAAPRPSSSRTGTRASLLRAARRICW